MRHAFVGLLFVLLASSAHAQPGKFPPDSLVNTKVIPHNTPVIDVIGQMRNFTGALGVRCQFCHVGKEGMPLDKFDFTKDEKRTKLVARQMMRMVQEINHRIDTLPERKPDGVAVTCQTCHRGANRPVPLAQLVADVAIGAGADSAATTYRSLRQRFYGRDTYDFGEISLNSAALRTSRARKFDEALALLKLNEEFFPNSPSTAVARGNVTLQRGDTSGAATAFREALRRDSTSFEARARLRDIGRAP